MFKRPLLFNHTAPPRGRSVAIVGIGGGNSVLAADVCALADLKAPLFSSETRGKLRRLLGGEIGASYRNPVDLYGWSILKSLREVVEVIVENEQIDNVLIHLPVGFVNAVNPGVIELGVASLMSLPPEVKRRIIIVLFALFTVSDVELTLKLEKAFAEAGLPVFPSASRAANALSKFIGYYERKAQIK